MAINDEYITLILAHVDYMLDGSSYSHTSTKNINNNNNNFNYK